MAKPFVKGTIDGLFALNHQFGCSQLGEDNENIKKLLCGVALNPNASFVLFVGLGCENNGLDGIKEYLKPYNWDNIAYFNCQDVDDEIEYGLEILKDFCDKASKLQREDVAMSGVGTNSCGPELAQKYRAPKKGRNKFRIVLKHI